MHSRRLSIALCVALFACSLLAQTDIKTDVDAVIANSAGTTRDVRLVGRHIFAIDAHVSELLVSLAETYKFSYELPREADPAAVLAEVPGADARARTERGYGFLQEKFETLQGFADGRGDKAEVVKLATETALLTWALKSHALVDAIGFRDGGTLRDGNAVGPQGTIEDWNGSSSLLGGGGNWSGTFQGWMNRRRQAELVGLNYPNADLSWLR